MIKIHYPDGQYCYRPLHTVHAVYRAEDGKLIARTTRSDEPGLKEFEILAFELLDSGIRYD